MTPRICFPAQRGIPGWSLAALLIALLPVVAMGLTGQGSSESGTLDSRPPVVDISYPAGGEEFTGGETENLTWTIDEDFFDDDPLPITVTILDGSAVLWSELVAPDPEGDYTYAWPVEDVDVESARLVINCVDHFGFSGTDSSETFAIISTWSDAPAPTFPVANRLEPNFPNPFNPHTSLRFALREAADVELAVFDLSGRKIAVLASGGWSAGIHAVVWNGKNLAGHHAPSGTYLARLRLAGSSITETLVQRMTLLK